MFNDFDVSFSDHKEDADDIERALELCRDIAKDVDEQVRAHERAQLLLEIYDKTEAKTTTTIRGKTTDTPKVYLRPASNGMSRYTTGLAIKTHNCLPTSMVIITVN